jgi:septal ring factor EnvC (AmiA/AmiB activator)
MFWRRKKRRPTNRDDLQAEIDARDRTIRVMQAEIDALAAVIARDRERIKAEAAAYARERAEHEGLTGGNERD